MLRKSDPAGRRALGSLLGMGGLGVLVVATAAACASSPQAAGASGTSAPVVAASNSSTAASSASATGSAAAGAPGVSSAPPAGLAPTASDHPLIPAGGGPVVTPKAQVQAVPAGGRLVAFDEVVRSKDGMTLYLGIESQGGACGMYDVVLEQTGTRIGAGLVHLSSGTRMCPMYVTHMLVEAKLSAPLGDRAVLDLANGQTMAPSVAP
jgi:hypothetical protein